MPHSGERSIPRVPNCLTVPAFGDSPETGKLDGWEKAK
jgi:hypothetical protein